MANDLVKKDVSYLGKDFPELRKNLITFIKSYFPEVYQDFTESSPGMMLLELAAYVGDVLGYYMDEQFSELFIDAKQRKSVISLAKLFGYRPKPSVASTVMVDIYLVVPATGTAGNKYPDSDYLPVISSGMKGYSNTSPQVIFETIEDINFAVDTGLGLSQGGIEKTIYETDSNDIPTKFLLKKQVQMVGAETKTFTQTIYDPQKYLKIQMSSDTVTEIVSVTDADDNSWYEVDTIAQDTIFIEQQNTLINDPELSVYSGSVPYLLKLKKTPKRYEVSIDENNLTYLLFGAGTSNSNDEELIPTPDNVGIPTPINQNKYDVAIDPENFLRTKSFGESPANTTFTITYRDGGGVASNVPSETITTPGNATFTFPVSVNSLNAADISDLKNSLQINNPEPATGGRSAESIESIRNNAIANFKSQKRCVTKEDYIIRAYALPAKFGSVAKVYVEKDDSAREISEDNTQMTEEGKVIHPVDPLALNMYVLGYNSSKQLTTASLALKRNLKSYLSQYRMITDTVNIVDGTIINVQVLFQIITPVKPNKNQVLARCINALKDYFHVDKWNFNQPIVYSEIYNVLNNVKDVQSVPSVKIVNIAGNGYSNTRVDLDGLTFKGIIYPPRTVAIFNVKYPDKDIVGSAL